MEDSSIYLRTTGQFFSCKVHPVVVFNILDHFIRRNEGHRVIGALLGYNNDGTIEIKNCFPVPHTEGEQVGVDPDYFHNMLDLHRKVSPKEIIVGWYATGIDIDENSVLIHEFFVKEMNQTPIHLLVDTGLTDYSLSIKAYTSSNISFSEDKVLGAQFLPVPVEFTMFDLEKIGVDTLVKGRVKGEHPSLFSDLENLEMSIHKAQQLLESVTNYVTGVLEDKIPSDGNIGRFLADTVSALPRVEPAQLEKMFNNSLQDLLMVVYLSNLTRTQLALAEKLQRV
jgi:translation initiation factor 3 subunit F